MKVVLIGFNVQGDIFPLGLSYLKSYAQVQHNDVQIDIKEFSFGNRVTADTNAFLEQQVIAYILQKNPTLVGFSTYIWNSELILNVAKTIKKINPQIKIMIGGVEVDDSFANKYVDYIVLGEGELAFNQILNHLKNNIKKQDIPNIAYLENNELVKTKQETIDDLDLIPSPYKLQKAEIDKISYPVIKIETSRGCPFTCAYCYYATKKTRFFSIEYLSRQIKYIFANYKFSNFTILDANFNQNKERMKEILNLISKEVKRQQHEIRINFELKPELIDQEVINTLDESNLKVQAEIGLQSIDKEVNIEAKRPFSIEKVKQGLELLNKTNINYKVDLMYGLPKDNFYKFLNSARFILNNSRQKEIRAHHFMQLNNTEFKTQDLEKKIVRYRENQSSMVVKTDTQDALDLYKTKLFIDLLNARLKLK